MLLKLLLMLLLIVLLLHYRMMIGSFGRVVQISRCLLFQRLLARWQTCRRRAINDEIIDIMVTGIASCGIVIEEELLEVA